MAREVVGVGGWLSWGGALYSIKSRQICRDMLAVTDRPLPTHVYRKKETGRGKRSSERKRVTLVREVGMCVRNAGSRGHHLPLAKLQNG